MSQMQNTEGTVTGECHLFWNLQIQFLKIRQTKTRQGAGSGRVRREGGKLLGKRQDGQVRTRRGQQQENSSKQQSSSKGEWSRALSQGMGFRCVSDWFWQSPFYFLPVIKVSQESHHIAYLLSGNDLQMQWHHFVRCRWCLPAYLLHTLAALEFKLFTAQLRKV